MVAERLKCNILWWRSGPKKRAKKVKKGVDKRVPVWYISKALERVRSFQVNKKWFLRNLKKPLDKPLKAW